MTGMTAARVTVARALTASVALAAALGATPAPAQPGAHSARPAVAHPAATHPAATEPTVTQPGAQSARPLSIRAARALPLGSTVTVSGVASTPSGVFESSFYDKGFAIQDRGAGIYIKTKVDLKVQPGRRIRVTGVLTDSSGLLTIVPASPAAVTLGHNTIPPRSTPRRTGRIGEATEGLLVRTTATITKPVHLDPPYGAKFFVDDGSGELTIFVNTQTGIDLSGLKVGQLVRVTGFSAQYTDHYEIDPRGPRDIVVLRSPR